MAAEFPLPDVIFYHLRASNQREIFRQISKDLERKKGADAQSLADLLVLAENAGGSVIGDGVAVVSCKAPATVISERVCALAKLARPVIFKGVENQMCDIVYIMATPENLMHEHLRDLSTIVRALRDRDLVSSLRQQSEPERMLNILRARNLARHTLEGLKTAAAG